ncbi:recombinase family protein [Kitasatospora sp. NPDC050463]|uniref:recombinase family protein n=1 Tax=Kitasatospora sp. NPDC050463 TaxID=3155786 RepID=UPI0033C0F23A
MAQWSVGEPQQPGGTGALLLRCETARAVTAPGPRGPGAAEFLTGELKGSHDPSGIVFTVLAAMSGMEREYIRDRTLEGHESARKRGKTIGGAGITDESMLSIALHRVTRR